MILLAIRLVVAIRPAALIVIPKLNPVPNLVILVLIAIAHVTTNYNNF